MKTSKTNPNTQTLPTNGRDEFHLVPISYGPTLSDWLKFALIVNSFIDTSTGHELPFDEVYDAIEDGHFTLILMAYAGRDTDFSFMRSPDGSFDALNSALRAAAAEFRGRHFLKGGVARNGFCLALAIVLEAIRQKFVGTSSATPHNLRNQAFQLTD